MTPDIKDESTEILLRKPAVMNRTGLANSTLYYLISRGVFPSPVKLGARSVAWKQSEIEQWINSRERSTVNRFCETDCPIKTGSEDTVSLNGDQTNLVFKG